VALAIIQFYLVKRLLNYNALAVAMYKFGDVKNADNLFVITLVLIVNLLDLEML
jgi:hypothetical protein